MHAIDCSELLKTFQELNKDKYIVEFDGQENWKDQDFYLSFSKDFVEQAYLGYKQKGEHEYNKAESIKDIFTTRYKGKLNCVGVVRFEGAIPDNWDDSRKDVALNEFGFQLYHVAKTLFFTLQQSERLELIEFKKFFTYVGSDDIEGLARKFAAAIKQSFSEGIIALNDYVKNFRRSFGTTRFFPITVLWKGKAYKTMMQYRSQEIEGFRAYIEREYVTLLRRLLPNEECMRTPLSLAEEGIMLYDRFGASLERLHETFSDQIGISGTFLQVIGLTIALPGIASTLPPPSFATLTSLIAVVFIIELSLLLSYSTGSIVKRELDTLATESRVYSCVSQSGYSLGKT